MPGIDVHCHLTHMEDPEGVAKEARKRLSAVVNVTAEIQHAEAALKLEEKFQGFLFTSLGLHPEYTIKYSGKQVDDYIEFIRQNRKMISAIGEIGLDYSWITKKEEQRKSKEIFQQMIDLGKELKLPVEVHSRNSDKDRTAISDAIKMLLNSDVKRAVLHCFSGNELEMKSAIESGYYVSFATIICRSMKHQKLAASCPIENMLLETDAPWLDPDSRELTNRPWKIYLSAELIAGIKSMTMKEVLQRTEGNARKVFGIG